MDRFSSWLKFTWRYLGRPRWDTGVTPPEIREYVSGHPAGRALDLGCGTGTSAMLLARAGWEVTAVDFSELAILRARLRAWRAGLPIRFLLRDVSRDLRLSGGYDLAFDVGCFHSIPSADRPGYVENIARSLRPGGNYLLYAAVREDQAISRGITAAELDLFTPILKLERREDGKDFGGWASAWFWFTRKDPA